MEISQSIENALKLCEIDFNQIQQKIEVEYFGSMESYLENVSKLANDFEIALSSAVLIQNQEQINSFAKLNIKRIQLAIKQVKAWEYILSKSEIEIESDPANSEIIEDFMHPIYEAHFNQLIYLEKILSGLLGTNNNDVNQDKVIDENEAFDVSRTPTNKKVDLSKYKDLLTMKDMEEIFRVKRNAIYLKEKSGHFSRSSKKNQQVLFNKADIEKYINNS